MKPYKVHYPADAKLFYFRNPYRLPTTVSTVRPFDDCTFTIGTLVGGTTYAMVPMFGGGSWVTLSWLD